MLKAISSAGEMVFNFHSTYNFINKKFLIVLLIFIVVTLSGCTANLGDTQKYGGTPLPTPSLTPITTSTPIHTQAPTPTIETPTPTPTPTLKPEETVVATPTGRIVLARVANFRFDVSSLQINAGDTILWENFDYERAYTIVEMDKKIANITLSTGGKVKYIFNTSGNYSFGLYYSFMRGAPSIQKISVRVNTSK